MKIERIQITDSSLKQEVDAPLAHAELKAAPTETGADAPRHGESMFVKIGLCGVAVLCALAIRSVTGNTAQSTDTQPASAQTETVGTSDEEENNLGALHFVDASQDIALAAPQKWTAPVQSADIELLTDSGTIRFTAAGESINACAMGEVLSISEDGMLGRYVRLTHADGVETIYFGLAEVLVKQGQVVQEGEALGTVNAGRSVYVQVLKDGAPQDPQDYISLSIGEAAEN